jgi:hypothetical protein
VQQSAADAEQLTTNRADFFVFKIEVMNATPHDLHFLTQGLFPSLRGYSFFTRVKGSIQLLFRISHCSILFYSSPLTSFIYPALQILSKETMLLAFTLVSFVALGLAFVFARGSIFHQQRKGQTPLSVNYFFTRQCNKSCKSVKFTSWKP